MKLRESASRWVSMSLVFAFLLLSLAACQTPAGRTGGEVVDDATITTKVKAKLLDENILRSLGISVETFGGDVTLTGAVDTSEQKDRAQELAKSVNGVKKVNNLIKIKNK
jgi:hyperosmotically inducible protein